MGSRSVTGAFAKRAATWQPGYRKVSIVTGGQVEHSVKPVREAAPTLPAGPVNGEASRTCGAGNSANVPTFQGQVA